MPPIAEPESDLRPPIRRRLLNAGIVSITRRAPAPVGADEPQVRIEFVYHGNRIEDEIERAGRTLYQSVSDASSTWCAPSAFASSALARNA